MISRLVVPTPEDEYAQSQLDSQVVHAQSPAHDCQGEYSHHLLEIVKVSMLRRARKRQDEWMYHQLTTIQVNVLHHRRATVNEVCFSTRKLATAKMIMLFCKPSTTKAGVHHSSGCSAAPQRKSGEMGASGRLQKRTGARHKFPLNPLVYLRLLLEHMEKAKAKAKGGRPVLALVSRCDQKCFCVFSCLSKKASPSVVLSSVCVVVIVCG